MSPRNFSTQHRASELYDRASKPSAPANKQIRLNCVPNLMLRSRVALHYDCLFPGLTARCDSAKAPLEQGYQQSEGHQDLLSCSKRAQEVPIRIPTDRQHPRCRSLHLVRLHQSGMQPGPRRIPSHLPVSPCEAAPFMEDSAGGCGFVSASKQSELLWLTDGVL